MVLLICVYCDVFAANALKMIPEIGQFALVIALLLALTQATLPLIGASRGNRTWVALAVPGRTGAVYLCHDRFLLSRLLIHH